MDLLKPFSQKHTNRSYGLTICVLRSGTGLARLGGWSVGLSSWDWYLLLTLGPSNCPVKHYPFPPPGPLSPFWGKKEKKKFFSLFSQINLWVLFQIIYRVKCICFLSLSSPEMLSLNHRWGVGGTAQANSSLGPRVFFTFPYLLPQRS